MKSKISVVLLGVSICLIAAVVLVSTSPSATGQDAGSVAKYKGSKACKACHKDEYVAWEGMKHSKAFASLKPDQIATGKDTKGKACVQCHTTGYGQGGFTSEAATPKLVNVGCESCHGPGSKHVMAQLMAMTEETEVTEQHISKSVGCTQCHNPHISYKKLYGNK